MSNKVYIETTIVSYLTARPSRDVIVAGAQQITLEWWENQRPRFVLYTSPAVLKEIVVGDAKAAEKRLQVLQNLPLLELTSEVLNLANTFMQQKALPSKAREDAVHIAVATVYELNYLLTWNCRHIANAELQTRFAEIAQELGYRLPRMCTPHELIGEFQNVA